MDRLIPYTAIVDAAFQTVTKILHMSGRKDLKVVVNTDGGSTACVTLVNKVVTVSLSSLSFDAMLTSREADIMTGFIIHECLHVIHTDFELFQKAYREAPMIKDILNGIEDVRMEDKEIQKGTYPGMKGLLSRAMTDVHAKGMEEAAKARRPWGFQDLAYFIAIQGRVQTGHYLLSQECEDYHLQCPPEVRPLLDLALQRLPALKDTRDAYNLARELYFKIPQDTREKTNQQLNPGNSKYGQSQGELDNAQHPTTGNVGKSDIFDKLLKDLTKAHPKDKKEGARDALDAKQKLNFNRKSSGARAPTPVRRPGALISQFERLVQAPESFGRQRYLTSGRYDRRSMVRGEGFHALNTFSRATYAPGRNVAVSVVIDGSGSMKGIMQTAHDIAFWVAYACDVAGAKTAAYRFSQNTLTTLINFGETLNYGPFVAPSDGGSTPLTASIMKAVPELIAQPAERHLFIAVTDGGCNQGNDMVTRSVKLMHEMYPTLTIAGIGIGDGAAYVETSFPYHQILSGGDELLTKGLPFLVDTLEEVGIAA